MTRGLGGFGSNEAGEDNSGGAEPSGARISATEERGSHIRFLSPLLISISLFLKNPDEFVRGLGLMSKRK